jgi:hypothetical protein
MTITHAALLLIVDAALALAVDLAALLTRIPCETGVPRLRRVDTGPVRRLLFCACCRVLLRPPPGS